MSLLLLPLLSIAIIAHKEQALACRPGGAVGETDTEKCPERSNTIIVSYGRCKCDLNSTFVRSPLFSVRKSPQESRWADWVAVGVSSPHAYLYGRTTRGSVFIIIIIFSYYIFRAGRVCVCVFMCMCAVVQVNKNVR